MQERGFYTLGNQISNLTSSYTCTPARNTCANSAASAYTQSINNYYTALDAAILAENNEQNKAILSLQRKNIKDAVIEKKQYKIKDGNNIEIAKTVNQFKVWPGGFTEPHYILSSAKGATPENVLTIDLYNEFGNPIQYTSRDGIVTSIIWGYGKIYPIAKIVGAGYTTASALVSQTALDNPSSTEVQILTELNNLRTGLAGTKAIVTTYTYNPGIGVATETDANGKTTTYKYDAFGRLQLIMDHNSNILKKYDYQYHQN
jgi:YD repeat-containing protein